MDTTVQEVTIEDFMKLDLRIAKIVNAEEVPEANKLVKLTVDVGGGVMKTCFAGIKKNYAPTELIGLMVIFVNNLEPRQMKFGLSEGMVLAACNEDHSQLALLMPMPTFDASCSALEHVVVPGWKVS